MLQTTIDSLFCRSFYAIIFGIVAVCLPALCAIQSGQPDADSAFADLEAQAALLVIIGLRA